MKHASKPPAEHLAEGVKQVLQEKGLWQDWLISDLPKSWEKYGDLVLFNGENSFKNPLWKDIDGVWRVVCYVLKVNRVALKHSIQEDKFRSPKVSFVWGSSPNSWVEHKDNGILYTWDVQRSMFSAGNAPERHRLSKLDCSGEVIVDMFAGIGYFTLPFLVKAKAKFVHACEWNPTALEALKVNLKKNHVYDKCIIYEGDCSKVCPVHLADRVNLGLLPSSEVGWEAACSALKPMTGGIMHIHENVKSKLKSLSCENVCASSVCSSRNMGCRGCHNLAHGIQNFEDSNPFLSDNLKQKYCSISIHSGKLHLKYHSQIIWKRLEWLFWAVHVCHRLFSIFSAKEHTPREVSVLNLHHVKSYAPHIDHLVLDVKCIPISIFQGGT